MTRGHVRDFVGHHSRHLIFLFRSLQQARIDIEKTARKCEGVDRGIVNYFHRERNLEVRIARHVLSHSVDVLVDDRVLEQLRGTLDFHAVLLADGNLLFLRNDALVRNFPVADFVDVVFLVVAAHRKSRETEYCQKRHHLHSPCAHGFTSQTDSSPLYHPGFAEITAFARWSTACRGGFSHLRDRGGTAQTNVPKCG